MHGCCRDFGVGMGKSPEVQFRIPNPESRVSRRTSCQLNTQTPSGTPDYPYVYLSVFIQNEVMARNRNRRKEPAAPPTPFEQARDELLQHVIRCGVLQAAPEHQAEWFDETFGYLGERYPELAPEQLAELRILGERFCQPPKAKQADGESAEPNASAA